jgi:spoIIIJ-associated protein
VAHAEASARTVDAAVTAASAQLGLRSDQVDVEVLEDPVPSTFGYIGAPARVRVTPRSTSPASAPNQGSSNLSATSSQGSAAGPGRPGDAAPEPAPGPTASAVVAATPPDMAGSSERSPAGSADIPSPSEPTATQAPPDAIASFPQDVSDETNIPNGSHLESAAPAGAEPTGESPSVASAPAGAAPAAQPEAASEASTAEAPSTTVITGSGNGQDARPAATSAEGSTGGAARGSRRTFRDRDEPIAPEMVEEDTERAGDFLEGLLDALDVDGDITTWVDEVGGHIDLEGVDLEPLIGPNGETLDSLQELTRLAVLRQSKRRVRLLLDINGFRARQRDQLVSIVRTTAEQVIRTREDHELQPMSPAERKIVHDAVAAIDGVRTESLGEDPNRRVIIRPT